MFERVSLQMLAASAGYPTLDGFPHLERTRAYGGKLQKLNRHFAIQAVGTLRKIASKPDDDYTRRVTFRPGGVQPVAPPERKRGRPRLAWAKVLYATVTHILPGGIDELKDLLLGAGGSMQRFQNAVRSQLLS